MSTAKKYLKRTFAGMVSLVLSFLTISLGGAENGEHTIFSIAHADIPAGGGGGSCEIGPTCSGASNGNGDPGSGTDGQSSGSGGDGGGSGDGCAGASDGGDGCAGCACGAI